MYQNIFKIPLDNFIIIVLLCFYMVNGYNLYNLEALFKNYLLAGIDNISTEAELNKLKRITIKNYLSDLRHFLGWLIRFEVKNENLKIEENLLPAIENADKQLIEDYKTYLLENKIPIKTINRRLSTLRKFFTFCVAQGWLNENPAKKVANIKSVNIIDPASLVSLYQKENKNYKEIETVKEFISFIS